MTTHEKAQIAAELFADEETGMTWQPVKSSVGLECHFQIKERDKDGTHFVNIEDVLFVDGTETVDGKFITEGAAQ